MNDADNVVDRLMVNRDTGVVVLPVCPSQFLNGGGILNGGAGYQILPEDVVALGMILPVGGFLTLGVVIATVQYFMSKPKKNKEVAK